MSKEEQKKILEQFFSECLRFWERELKVSSDESREPYANAIIDIPTCNPYNINGEPLDKEVVAEFKKYRLMDCYGKDWERYV